MANKKQKEPLFYIQQPTLQFPKTNMQESYSSRKAEMQRKAQMVQSIETKASDREEKKQDKLGSLSKSDARNESKKQESASNQRDHIQKTIEEFETGLGEKEKGSSYSFQTERKSSFRKLKSFKEMSVAERLQYLVEFPKQLPPVPCIFETKNKSHKGFLLKQENERIELKSLSGDIEQISIQEIKDIKMIGLRK
ncbi:hypothetical protein J2Z40_001757 [Cytobacillus eiseniae]|uniref:Spore coat protein CotO n=1 Tax=Cytobacillus eiseniae TaxID=762947 RepID=A0ABS4RE68_9BACI|nr:CotO family spore coat protein [Cytobacillus eiseniae]MBP2241195.1 hypothetical protein [Cytobacillus eiseniae]